MATDAVTTARSLFRQGLDPDRVTAALRAAGYTDAEAEDAVRAAAADPDPAGDPDPVTPPGPRSTDPPRGRGPRRGTDPRARGRAPRTRTGRAVGRFETGFDRAAREAGRISLTPPRRVTARDGAGFLFGLFGYVLVLQYVRHGGDGVKGWLAAKFVNKPWSPPGPTTPVRGRGRDRGGDGLGSTRPRPPVAV